MWRGEFHILRTLTLDIPAGKVYPPSLAGVILELDDAPFKREVKYVVFFIAGTMRRSDYRREKCPPTGGIREVAEVQL